MDTTFLSSVWPEWTHAMHALNIFDHTLKAKVTDSGEDMINWADYPCFVVTSMVATRCVIRFTYNPHNATLSLWRDPIGEKKSEIWESGIFIAADSAYSAAMNFEAWLDSQGMILVT